MAGVERKRPILKGIVVVLYEYPVSEKIRSFLRLEYLFQRLSFFHQHFAISPESDESLLGALFDVMDVCERGDVRSALLQELDKQKNTLQEFRNYPEINLSAIDTALIELTHVSRELHDTGKVGRAVRESEWLSKIKSRYVVPGGLSSTEFPAYRGWLMGSQERRQEVVNQWVASFKPLSEAIDQLLHFIRASREPEYVTTAENGVYERSLAGQPFQLIRVWVPESNGVYPEISANKYVAFVRLYQLSQQLEAQLVTKPIGFKIAFCNF